jgi:hypothetical protein
MTDAISFIHSALGPNLKRGVSLLLGVTFLGGGDIPFVGFVDR